MQGQITRAFRALSPLASVESGRRSLQGYDVAMRLDLLSAGDHLSTEDGPTPAKVTMQVGRADVVRPREATVPLTVSVTTKAPPPSFSLRFTGVALEIGGHWQVSWTTMCMLLESAGSVCPDTPGQVWAGDIVPTAENGPDGSSALTSGLVNPKDLAAAPGGGVLIGDQARNQILKWDNGQLSVVAGNGLQGFAGDGSPAVDAELNDPGEIAVGPTGIVYFADSGNKRVRAVLSDGDITTVAGDGSTGIDADSGDGGLATRRAQPEWAGGGPTGELYFGSGSDISNT